MDVVITRPRPRSTSILLKDMTPGQVLALKNALKVHATPVALDVLEEIEDAEQSLILQ